jgi:deoxyribonuclease-2
VDWWIALKAAGSSSYYIYSSGQFKLSSYSLASTTGGAIMNTVNQIYNNLDTSNVAYAAYSDQPPDVSDKNSNAHAKGVMATDSSQGFYLIHSMPHWPNPRSSGAGPFPDFTYGQSLMCMTFAASHFDSFAYLQIIAHSYVYDSLMSSNMKSALPTFYSYINSGTTGITSDSRTVSTKGGKSFTQYQKSKNWGKDLYEDLIAPSLNKDLYLETWRTGSGGRIGSMCGAKNSQYGKAYNVYMVQTVQMPDGVSWSGTMDHSKWTISTTSTWVCVGDMNNMCSQETRGGGTMCMQDSSAWSAFYDVIAATEACWAYNPCDPVSGSCYWCPTTAEGLVPVDENATTLPVSEDLMVVA